MRSTLEWEAAPTSTDKLADTSSASTPINPWMPAGGGPVAGGEWGAPPTPTDNFGDLPHAKFSPHPCGGAPPWPRGAGAPLSAAGKVWKGLGTVGNALQEPHARTRADHVAPALAQFPLLSPFYPAS